MTKARKTATPKQDLEGWELLRPGEVLHYRKASIQRVITGWKPITASSVATYYNAGGDAVYASKLSYALTAVRKEAEAPACN
ncbi:MULTISPECIES: hypothetical protein [unclassified Variovorax]|uniref:hypothetical protein n=1 Tax=unclassified Variovorax TaxID=663243 RepID=UPI003F473AD7